MPENNQADQAKYTPEIPDDEIDLVELVAILWRRRWLMVGVFAVIVGLAIAYCFIATPKYEITAQLSPGITGLDDKGNPVHAWSPKDLENWFSQEGYLEAILGVLGEDVGLPELKASNIRQSNVVNVSFYWPDAKQGKQLLESVIDFLTQRGNKSIQQLIGNRRAIQDRIFQLEKDKELIPIERGRLEDEVLKTQQKFVVDKQSLERDILKLAKDLEQIPIEQTRIDNQIAKANNQIKVLNTKLSSLANNKTLAKEAVSEIKKRIDGVNRNTEELMRLRQNTLTGNSDELALLMYSNIIQQNISFAMSLQTRIENLEKEMNRYIDEESARAKEIDDIKIEIEDLKVKRDEELAMKKEQIEKNILKLRAELAKTSKDAEIKIEELKIKRNKELTMKADKLQENIETLQTRLSTLTPLEVNQPPFSSPEPVKPSKRKIVALAIVLAGFLAVLTAFIKEFWIKNRERVTAVSIGSKN